MLRNSAAAAVGLVWSAPLIRTVDLHAADSGSPPPQSSTTTSTNPPIVHEFAAEIPPTLLVEGGSCPGDTFFNGSLSFTADLGTLGSAEVELHYCTFQRTFTQFELTGSVISLVTPEGAAEGALTGEIIRRSAGPSAFDYHLQFEITDGTGAFVGATGSGAIEGVLPFDDPDRFFSGEISGSITVS